MLADDLERLVEVGSTLVESDIVLHQMQLEPAHLDAHQAQDEEPETYRCSRLNEQVGSAKVPIRPQVRRVVFMAARYVGRLLVLQVIIRSVM